MHSAAHYATVNRALISEMIRQRATQTYGKKDNRLITDVPHNIILKEDGFNVHRKGATPAHNNELLLIPGSMGAESYLLNGLGNKKWIKSASHGAGRSVSRNKMSFKGKRDFNILGLNGVECISLKEERKIEEAPGAYKDIGPVIKSQVEEQTVEVVAVFSPLVTFKA
jgi:tRNA-splicing ligase RtcB